MSQGQRETVKAGIFVIISGVMFVLFLVVLLGRSWFTHEKIYYTVFDSSVQGLEAGSPVKYLGVPAGTVSDIRFQDGKFPNIRVTMKLKPYTPVKESTRAMLIMTNLTGVAQIELVGGGAQEQEIGDGAYIQAQPSAFQRISESLPKFIEKLPGTLDRVEQAATNLGKFFGDENQQRLVTVIGHADESLALFNKTLDTTSKNVREEFTSTAQDARKSFAQVRDDLTKTLEEIRKLVGGAATNGILDQLDRFAQSLNSTGEKIDQLVGNLQTGIQADQRSLRDVLGQLKEVGVDARELISRLRQNPSSILFANPTSEKEIPDPEKDSKRKKP